MRKVVVLPQPPGRGREELALVDRQVDVDHLEIAEEFRDLGENDMAIVLRLECHRAGMTLRLQGSILGGEAP